MSILKKIVEKVLSIRLFNFLLKKKIFIFCLHDISEENATHFSEYYSTTPDSFRAFLNFIQLNFDVISINELNNFKKLDKTKSYAVITFDDGFNSVFTTALPVLKEMNMPFTVFINKTAVLEGQLWFSNLVLRQNDKVFLSHFYENYFSTKEEQIKSKFVDGEIMLAVKYVDFNNKKIELIPSPPSVYANLKVLKNCITTEPLMTVGSHTENHPNLGNCSKEIQESEIERNHNFLKENLNIECQYFAFPFGKKQHYNMDTQQIVKSRNYLNFTTNPYYIDLSKDELPTVLPRIPFSTQTMSQIIFLINRTIFKKIDI